MTWWAHEHHHWENGKRVTTTYHTMTGSICPHCRKPIELLNDAWICVRCWKRWK